MFSSFFSKKKSKEKKDKKNNEILPECIENDKDVNIESQIEWLEKNNWLSYDSYNEERKNILIMDDREEIISSIIDDLEALEELESSEGFRLNDYNIISVSSKMAGFYVIEILKKAPDIVLDYALLDIVLGGKKVVNDKRMMVDGVDIAIKIWEHFPQAEILFFSGCIIESSTDESHFKTRFDKYTNDDLNNYILPKDMGFDEELERLKRFFN